MVRTGQRRGLIAGDVRPELVLILVLGAGSHLFDVTALAQESTGIDPTARSTQDDFVATVRAVLQHGILREAPRLAKQRERMRR